MTKVEKMIRDYSPSSIDVLAESKNSVIRKLARQALKKLQEDCDHSDETTCGNDIVCRSCRMVLLRLEI